MSAWDDDGSQRIKPSKTEWKRARDKARLAAALAALDEAREALFLCTRWIDNWEPNFTRDDEWPEDRAAIDAALARIDALKGGPA